uniref:Trafficking protein particle complex subunit 5 n=1 Tax=Phallusia mammillata TaxID=59560 RepID=A0A6F9DW15_9ASCI|nr:trafficking protein particle complex subunit 5-like [Phallusia mammillata]
MDSGKRFRSTILDKQLSRGKQEVSLSVFALLFSEMIQYSQNRVRSVSELQSKLSDFGYSVGTRLVDLLCFREKGFKRETKLINILMFVKVQVWKALFGKEADKLEQASDDDKIYYIIEKEPIISTFICVPRDKGSLNCASFIAGIVEAVLNLSNFPAKVTAHWHKGTTLMIKFEESVIARDKALT